MPEPDPEPALGGEPLSEAQPIFLDTNVLLYLLSDQPAKADRAEAIASAGGVISVQVLNEFASVGLRKLKLQVAEVRDILATIRLVCTVVPLDVDTHRLGLELVERYQLALYDAMIVAAALRTGCATLYSEDLQHGQAFGSLRVMNPFRADGLAAPTREQSPI